MARHEREFFNEKQELKPAMFTCPKCRHRAEYQVRWIRRLKKDRPPQGADAQDHEMHRKLRDCMVRVDEMLSCQKCRRRFEIPSQQSVVFFDRDAAQNSSAADTGGDARRSRQPRGRGAGWV
ncbi:MAG: hypothetical protein QF681_04480 [Vicinamibacterales bacterium]|jgi:uncharacterized protein YbaR (Trm112 family)|nr:hypothetical protein [Vicinamibacterales bacterium]